MALLLIDYLELNSQDSIRNTDNSIMAQQLVAPDVGPIYRNLQSM